jgi:NAD(P)-dependent dehydrogenase (short-subunit alcohol dehydrogenase family)
MEHPIQDNGLRGKTALVTGAGRGIGRGAAVGVARRGARVIIVDVTDDELEVTLRLVREAGAEAWPIRADLARRDEIDRTLREAEDVWESPGALVNNAAVLFRKSFEQTDPEIWDETLDVNLGAPYYLTWRVYQAMLARGHGNIITMSSNAGVRAFPLQTAYCASKYALEGLFRSLALEAASRGIIVTLATPGKTTKPTSMSDASFAALPPDEQARYSSPLVFAEAFGYLAGTGDLALSGRRFDLFALSELIREQGLAVPGWLALQRAERNTPWVDPGR